LSFAVVAITQSVVGGQKQTYNALHELRAGMLAESLLEEVLVVPYADRGGDVEFGPDNGEGDRSDFDGIDDFDGFRESVGSTVDAQGEAYGIEFSAFGRSVSVSSNSMSLRGLGDPIDGVEVVVTVFDDHGRQWTMKRFVPEPAP
jgi:hypothetical protein